MADSEEEKKYSVQITVQRTTIEYGFVSVLLTSELADDKDKLDTDKLLATAAKVSKHPEMQWYSESVNFSVNPIQKPSKDEKVLALDPHGVKLRERD